ncbi:hypothetical protein C8R47DRAFT_1290844 [Mycena vitilis]|nr:hypothetical protein C8R47DRAFT_1290844 [Mycena vitilis]
MAMGAFPTASDPVQEIVYLMVTRYINGAAFVVLLYDHLLSLGDEVALIWPTRWSAPKVLYLVIRYMVPCTMLVFTMQLAGLSPELKLSDGWVSAFSSFILTVVQLWWLDELRVFHGIQYSSYQQLCVFISIRLLSLDAFFFLPVLILLRLWVIWDRNRTLVVWSLFLFVLAQLGGLATTSYLIWRIRNTMYWNADVRSCGFHAEPPMAVIWAPGTAFEVVLCAITWWNALTQPRRANTPMAAVMYRDGFLYFLLLLCLRIVNTVLVATAPAGLIMVAMFPVWCATTTTTCRLILTLRQIDHKDRTRSDDLCNEDMSVVAAHSEYDELVRSGARVEMLRSAGPSTPIRPRPSEWTGV